MTSRAGECLRYTRMQSEEPTNADSRPQTAEQVHGWIARHLPDRPHPPVKRPVNWIRLVSTVVILLGGGTFAFVAWPYVLPIIQSRNVWAAGSLIAILLFTSGHMYNHIRQVPYVAADGRGGITYFAGGFQNQLGLETQIVAAFCEYRRHQITWVGGRLVSTSTNDAIRRYSLLCGHIPCHQGAARGRSQNSANRCVDLGSRHVDHVQLPPQHLQTEERRLPLCPASLHVDGAVQSAMPSALRSRALRPRYRGQDGPCLLADTERGRWQSTAPEWAQAQIPRTVQNHVAFPMALLCRWPVLRSLVGKNDWLRVWCEAYGCGTRKS